MQKYQNDILDENTKLAHISPDGRKQSIRDHLEGTAKLAAGFAITPDLQREAEYIGLMHDIGKYSEAFQRRLQGGPKVDHSSAGAFEAFKANNALAAFCIAGHHAGIPNLGSKADVEGSTLFARINRAKKGCLEDYSTWAEDIFPNLPAQDESSDILEMSFKIRMLFSCLVDADYLDTEKFMNGGSNSSRGGSFDEFERKIERYIGPWKNPSGQLNCRRMEILQYAESFGKKEACGIYTMTVPTGGGKTVASLSYAVHHANANGLKRIIYVVPYTSIIEQTADVYREILGVDNVLEHHSNVEYKDDEDSVFKIKATSNWDFPVVVTTSVQFFESLYSNKSSTCRKIHNMSDSVIVLDEAQMLPVPYVKPCVKALAELVSNYNSSVLLCTATQPALKPIIEEYMPHCCEMKEICDDEIFEDEVFKRVTYRQEGVMSSEDVAHHLQKCEQSLCIVNSRKAAQDIYQYLSGEGCFHLSTNMYPEHRKLVIAEIRERLKKGISCCVVSTSLIEAGIDIDFPCVYRQIAGLDSIVQAAGRCNREGKRHCEDSVVHIFDLECGSPRIFSVQIAASKQVMNKYKDYTGKEAMKEYYETLFYLNGEQYLDQRDILREMERLNFSTTAKLFRLIDESTKTVYIETEENEGELLAIKQGFAGRDDYRRLSLFGVNVYEYQYNDLMKRHALEMLEDGSCVLVDSNLYTDELGLNMEYSEGEALFI